MRRTPSTWGLGFLAALTLSSLALTASSLAGTTDTVILREPVLDTQYNRCVDELVTTTGVLHVVEHTTTTQNGETQSFTLVYQGMTGTGMLTGVRYVVTHVENQSSYSSASPPPIEVTDRASHHQRQRAGERQDARPQRRVQVDESS